jgi:chromosome segregation ATPase
MVVKDYLQALADENLIRVEKIGSGNWYWCFTSDAKKTKENVLKELKTEEGKLKASIISITEQIDEETAQREDDDEMLEDAGMDRKSLLGAHETLVKDNAALAKELEGYSDNDPTELLKKERETKMLKESAERWSDNIEAIECYLKELTGDRAQVAQMMQAACDDEYVLGEGLKEL